MKTYAYYPGCSLEASSREYDTSVRAVFNKIGIELKEVPDWSCCGSSQAHKIDGDMAAAIAGRNLALASSIGDIIAPCASCSMSLKEAQIELEHDGPIRRVLVEAGYEYLPGSVSVLSAVEAAYQAVESGLFEGKISSPLLGLKVASYYGCLLVRPPKIAQFDDPENPVSMDRIMEMAGAKPVEWSHKVDCCGNAYILVDRNMTLNLVSNILNAAVKADADVIAAACPLCMQNLAERQAQMQQRYGLKRKIPVVYFTQLIGAAMGLDNRMLGLKDDLLKLIDIRRQEEIAAREAGRKAKEAEERAKEARRKAAAEKEKAAKEAKEKESTEKESSGTKEAGEAG
ncbi:MAG: CoB--CoM heterodisulfide reductase iron-sulfur subunit B family protein [Actinomycetota bacterium]|nr:CoB--CoM heterodisulfide reductase iron-sulfur subunit B family protein [Actinomycetota bacterium]